MTTEPQRHLFVTSRRADGLITPVGRLTQYLADDTIRFRFVYLKLAERFPDFTPLPGFPRLYEVYDAGSLFPVFANRLMPRARADFGRFLEQLDLTVEADPFEVLARSEGVRATDRIEVFPAPTRSDAGYLTTLFFTRGIRHLDGASEAVANVTRGDELVIDREPTNPFNPRAVLLNTRTGRCVGWAPEYLLDLVDDLNDLNGSWPQIVAEHVNGPEAPPHIRLLCRLTATWPAGYVPFSGPDFQPLAGD